METNSVNQFTNSGYKLIIACIRKYSFLVVAEMAGDEMDATNCIIIGSLGVVEFSVFFLFAILSFFYSKNQRARVGFLSIALYCTLELPRYISLIYDQAYDSRSTFIIFIFANFFFSVTFSTYCMLLNDSARVIPPRTVDLVRPAYLIFFLCYMGLCIAASYEMVTAASFDGGRDSFEYDALDVFEATSFIFFGALSIYLVHCLHFQLHELSVRMATEGSDVDVAIKARFSNCSNPADIQLKIEENILQRELVLDKLYSVGRLVLVAALVRGVVLFLGYERPNYDGMGCFVFLMSLDLYSMCCCIFAGPVYWALSALIPR